MTDKHEIVRRLLQQLGPVAVRELAGPVQVPFGTIMNIRGGQRSTWPRYDNVYKLYRHFMGDSPCELAYVTERLKAMKTSEVLEFARQCGVSYHTLMKIKQQRQKYAPRYAHVHAAYCKLKKKGKVPLGKNDSVLSQ